MKKGLAVADSAAVTESADLYDLTLDQAAVLIEFEDDEEALVTLSMEARERPAQFDHAVQRARVDRARAASVAALTEELSGQGWPILDRSPGYYDSEHVRLVYLTTKGGEKITQDALAAVVGGVGGHASLGDIDEFLDEVGYRHPAEAQNGHLPRHFWNPRHNYNGIEGSAADG